MKLDRVMIAAPKSGSGKTTITCALLQSLKEQGIPVVSYKCGPDYIDPMFHKEVLGVPSKNLDTFFTGEEETRALLTAGRTEGEACALRRRDGIVCQTWRHPGRRLVLSSCKGDRNTDCTCGGMRKEWENLSLL